jgi:hypothetical protein
MVDDKLPAPEPTLGDRIDEWVISGVRVPAVEDVWKRIAIDRTAVDGYRTSFDPVASIPGREVNGPTPVNGGSPISCAAGVTLSGQPPEDPVFAIEDIVASSSFAAGH